jgi:Pyridoxamine 5'-phosphate oxidase
MADDRTARARLIVENGAYMTLATADASGAPWVTPVWYALESLSSLIWISRQMRGIRRIFQCGRSWGS